MIQRYEDCNPKNSAITESDSGDYVLYSDHLEAMKKEREELIAWLGYQAMDQWEHELYAKVIANLESLGK